MNERIEELMLRSGTTGVRQVWFTRPELAKFAELIVGECIEVLRKEMDRLDTIPGRELSAQCFETAGVLVLKHFGVE